MPSDPGGRPSKNSSRSPQRTCRRTRTFLPQAMPCAWKTFPARSSPTLVIVPVDTSHGGPITRCSPPQIQLEGSSTTSPHSSLPAFSPDLNPIEMVFAKFKTLLRKADERSVEATWRRIGEHLCAFTPKECAAHLRIAAYASVMA